MSTGEPAIVESLDRRDIASERSACCAERIRPGNLLGPSAYVMGGNKAADNYGYIGYYYRPVREVPGMLERGQNSAHQVCS